MSTRWTKLQNIPLIFLGAKPVIPYFTHDISAIIQA